MSNNITIAYIPVLHAGYLEFLRKYNQPLYLIGGEIISELVKTTPYYERDIRALPVQEMKTAIEALNLVPSVSVLDLVGFDKIKESKTIVVAPDEDISHDIMEKFLPVLEVKYDNVFLRWNRKISDKEFEITPGRIISETELDGEMMLEASRQAEKSSDWWRQIGALAVRDGKILFSAYNHHLPSERSPYALGDPRSSFNAGERPDLYTSIHAEADMIAQAARKGVSLLGSSVYSTTFPCPNCARLLAKVGISKVYYQDGYSSLDAEQIFENFGIEIVMVKKI